MNESEKVNFLEMLTGMAEIFDKKLSEVVIEIYWQALKQYPLDGFKKAVNNIVQQHKYSYFPRPAEFIEYITPPEALEFKAELGLAEWIDAYCNVGEGGNPEFDDSVVALVCQHYGGWLAICNSFPRCGTDKDQEFWFKDFKNVYRGYSRRPVAGKIPEMIGSREIENYRKGYIENKPESDPKIENSENDDQKLIS